METGTMCARMLGLLVAMPGALVAAPAVAARGTDDAPDVSGRRLTLVHEGVGRSYLLRMPERPPRAGERPALVLVLHGGGGNAANAERMTGFTRKARREGFIVAYPEGSSRFRGRLLTWNAGHCCGYAMTRQVDDVGFISALIDTLVAQYQVDPSRVYVTGMSNGGMMAHRLGIELSNKIAAIAPVVATLFGDERRPASAVSAVMINGMLDQSVPYQGGLPGGRFSDAWDGTPAQPATAQGAFWSRALACDDNVRADDRGALLHWRYGCPSGAAVEAYLVKDNGHAWPGGRKGSSMGDEPSMALDATQVIWEFFTAHPKPDLVRRSSTP